MPAALHLRSSSFIACAVSATMQVVEQLHDGRVAAEASGDERAAHDHAHRQQHLQRNAARVRVSRSWWVKWHDRKGGS